jgi:hypothetical protein
MEPVSKTFAYNDIIIEKESDPDGHIRELTKTCRMYVTLNKNNMLTFQAGSTIYLSIDVDQLQEIINQLKNGA